MALLKKTMTKYGFEAEYWKLDACTLDKRVYEASCVLSLYKDKDASANSVALEDKYITLYMKESNNIKSMGEGAEIVENNADEERKELFEQYFGKSEPYNDVYEAFYMMVKDLDSFFADATDC